MEDNFKDIAEITYENRQNKEIVDNFSDARLYRIGCTSRIVYMFMINTI